MSLFTRAPSHEDETYLAHLAYRDPLTDLPNRVRLAERLSVSLPQAAERGGSVVLLSIDLDGFKAVNEGLGHEAADELLCQVAGRLESIRRPTDLLVRHGGDEFGLLAELEPCVEPPAVVSAIAERITRVLETPFTLAEAEAEAEVRIGASVGAAIYPTHALDERTLQRHTDRPWTTPSSRAAASPCTARAPARPQPACRWRRRCAAVCATGSSSCTTSPSTRHTAASNRAGPRTSE